MLYLHALAAALATWRLVDLLASDRLFEPLRWRLPTWYVLTCPRCLSVWMGIVTTAAFAFVPWLNWPLALSWCYIWQMESRRFRQQQAAVAAAALRAVEMAEQAQRRFGGAWPGQVKEPPHAHV